MESKRAFHHPADRLTACERRVYGLMLTLQTADASAALTTAELAGILEKDISNTAALIESLGLRLPLTHRPWRLKRHDDTVPARWSLISVQDLRASREGKNRN
jgi:hypothetical protein